MRKLFRKIFLAILANAAAVFVVSQIFPDRLEIVATPIWKGFLIVGVAIGFLNTFVKPLLKILSLPLVIVTAGLFLILINAAILFLLKWLFENIFSPLGVEIIISGGLLSFAILGFSLAVLNGFLHWLLKE